MADDTEYAKHVIDFANLPDNPDVERLILGACLTDYDSLQQTIDAVLESDFFLRKHRLIFTSIRDLFLKGGKVDATTVARDLYSRNELILVDGLSYLVGLECAKLQNLDAYVKILLDDAMRRKAITVAVDFIQTCMYGTGDDGSILNGAEQLLASVSSDSSQMMDRPKTVGDIVAEHGGVDAFLSPDKTSVKITIPFRVIDATLGGLRQNRLYFCAARPGAGKTALMQQLAESSALQGFRALVISAEMEDADLIRRSICGRADASMYRFLDGTLVPQERYRVQAQLSGLVELDDNLLIYDRSSVTIQKITQLLRYQVSIHKPVNLLLIDYVQILESLGKQENRVQELAKISKGLLKIKKDFKIPVWVLAQINRMGEERSEPELRDIRECGQLEQDADAALLLWIDKEEQELEITDPKRPALEVSWKIAKHRNGMKNRSVRTAGFLKNGLTFWKSRARFDEDNASSNEAAA